MNRIGKYRIQGLLGRGGMSKVYQVEHPLLGKMAALKVLAPHPSLVDLLGMQHLRERFYAEAVMMAGLRHPNIIDVWDLDEEESTGQLFYLMDYHTRNIGIMIGESLHADMPSRILNIDRALEYTLQTLQGLACLHEAGIVHRDIKPFNLLLTDYHRLKICDFGLSKNRGESFGGPSNLKVGSPWYAAPEQEQDPDDVDRRSDLYSVGVIFYRMLTGRLPGRWLKLPSTVNPDLNQQWDSCLLKALAAERSRRFSSAKQMLHALEELQADWQTRKATLCRLKSPSPPPSHLPRSSRRHLRGHPIKVAPREARSVFGTDDLWRPRHHVSNLFESDRSNSTVSDRATGLTWQQAGAPYPITWHQAHNYIAQLNQSVHAKRSDWRLPTIEELMSLLAGTPHGQDYCLPPVFDSCQRWLWSSDRRSYLAAWYVSLELGFIAWQDFRGSCHVKAVCGPS